VYRAVKPYPDCFVVEQVYKNKFQGDGPGDYGFREVMEAMRDNPEWVYSQPEGSVELWIGPRGGNGESAGSHCMPPVTSKNKNTTHISPTHQKFYTSKGMDENCWVLRAVIHLWSPVPWMEDPVATLKISNSSPQNGMIMYLGLWSFHSKIEKQRPERVWKCNPNTNWLAEQSTLYYIRPLYNASCPPPEEHVCYPQLIPVDVEEGVYVHQQMHQEKGVRRHASDELRRCCHSLA
jgi:hypothetical protein